MMGAEINRHKHILYTNENAIVVMYVWMDFFYYVSPK